MFEGKKILILGLARSGIAVADLLLKEGAILTLCDQKDNKKLRESLKPFENKNVNIYLKANPLDYIEKQDILLISPGVPIDSPIVLKAKELGIEVLGELEVSSRLCKNTLLAITGTNGKTTSVSLLGEIIRNSGIISHVVGNIGLPFSSVIDIIGKEDYVVCEVSSFQMESSPTFHPSVAALLNITEDHLDRHYTMQEYIRLKFSIFANQNKHDVAVLNYDDKTIRENVPNIKSKIMWFAHKDHGKDGAYVDGENLIVRYNSYNSIICNINDIRIPGEHNLENAMAVCCMAIALNIKPQVIAYTLKEFMGVKHRIETVATKNGVTYINDSKGTNPDSTLKAIAAMKQNTVIILGGYDKHADFDTLACALNLNKFIKKVVLIGQTAEKIAKSLEKYKFVDYTFAKDMEEAVRISSIMLSGSYNVLLSPACASFDMYDCFEQRGDDFINIVNNI